MTRNFQKEYKDYHGHPEQIKRRASRNKARRKMGLKVGDKREVEHKDGNANNNSRSNLSLASAKFQRSQGGKKHNPKPYTPRRRQAK